MSNCYTYFDKLVNININYLPISFYEYYRYTPDYFRYVDPAAGTDNYVEALKLNNEISECLIFQLDAGPLKIYSLEDLFIRLVPSKNDSKKDTDFKDCIRNQFIAFCLNIEKTYLFYYKGKRTCNNLIVPWEAVWGAGVPLSNPVLVFANTKPLNSLDQVIIYKLAVNFFNRFFTGNKQKPFNYYNIIRKALGLPVTNETYINFYELIYVTFILMSELFKISKTLLEGKDPGLPKQFIELYFPYERQKYYYNYYLTWIESRNRYLGFGDKINSSNGSGTYIPIG